MYLFPKHIYVSLIFVLLSAGLLAQDGKVFHQVFSKRDGLEIDNVRALAYDDDGFLWIGGNILDVRTIVNSSKRNRLQRFNGSVFHNVYLPETLGAILRIDQLLKRADGYLYVRAETSGGHRLLLLNPETTEFSEISFEKDTDAQVVLSHIFQQNGKHYILRQQEKLIWVYELMKNNTTKPIFSFTDSDTKYAVDASTVFVAYKDFCMIGDDNFPIRFYNWDGEVLKRFSSDNFSRERNIHVEKFYLTNIFKRNDTVFGFPKNKLKLHFIDTKTLAVLPVPYENNTIATNQFFVHTDTLGATVLVHEKANPFRITKSSKKGFAIKEFEGVSRGNLNSVFSNNSANEMWLGSSENELHYLKFPSKVIQTILPEVEMRALFELDNNTLLIATENKGWFEYDIAMNSVKPYVLTAEGQPYTPSSSRNIIRNGNTLWSNNFSQILEIDLTTKKLTSYRHYPVVSMEELNDSTLVYGTRSYNLMQFDKRTKQHSAIIRTDSLFIYDIAIHDNFLVGATDRGMLTYNFITEESRLYNDEEILKDSFLLMTDYQDEVGFVTGSRKGYVGVFDPTTKNWKQVYEDPLQAGIATIIYDENLWCINTFNGMVFYDTKTETSTRFSTADGLSHNEANRYSALKTDSTYWVGSLKGINYFSPTTLAPKTISESLRVQKIGRYHPKKIAPEVLLNQKAIASLESIVLPAEHRELLLDVALTNTTAPNKNTYKFRLNEGDWSTLKQGQSISFTNMAPGNYELEVIAEDFSGNKIGESLTIPIIAKNFFYRTWWFYLMAFLFVVFLLLYFLFQSKQKQRLQERFAVDLLVSQENERNRIAKELHDSVGQQLTLIKKRAQKDDAQDIASLTNTVLEEVRGISRGLYPANLKLLGLTESVEQLVFDHDEQSDIFFSVSTNNVDAFFNKEETLNIFRFVQECLSNSLKHASATAVEVTIVDEPKQVIISVSDNGTGFDATNALTRKSLGLKTLAERIKIVKGSLNIKSNKQTGTLITATIQKK